MFFSRDMPSDKIPFLTPVYFSFISQKKLAKTIQRQPAKIFLLLVRREVEKHSGHKPIPPASVQVPVRDKALLSMCLQDAK